MTAETIQHLESVASLAAGEDESLFRKIFERSGDAILVVDPGSGLVIDANPAACKALRCEQGELRAAPLAAHFSDQQARLEEFFGKVLHAGQGTLNDVLFGGAAHAPTPVDISASVLEAGGERYLLLMLHDLGQRQDEEHLLRAIVEGTAALTGEEFFRALVKNLAQVLEVDYCFVAEFTDVKTRVRILARWTPEGFGSNVEFDLAGTPCEVVLRGEIRHYPQDLCGLFPRDKWMVRIGAQGYLAIPMIDPQGNVLGHLAIVHTQAMPMATRDLSIFRIFAARATAELLRQQADRQRQAAERALKESEERLANILASALDAVITFDEEHHIVLFNTAAEKVFHCSAEWAKGQPFDRFLSRPFRSLLERYLDTLRGESEREGQLWAPDGLTALRAEGEEFPIEATISSMQAAGKRFYTVILRDVNERNRAEQALRRLSQENRYLQQQLSEDQRFENIVGNSATMRAVFTHLQKVAGGDTTVLLLGETGTGKELIARAVHNLSPRKDKLLVKMNCAALPSELIESELFGHEKGAFTGATAQRKGRFELADGGTLFLDEVGELSLPAQAKLLRVLQEQEFERVGGSQPIRVDVRVIAATNRDLGEMVKANAFRADLYYRLNVFPIRIPPLRERKDDIPVLARYFLQNLDRKLGKPLTDLSPRAQARLLSYGWPGNVRELQNVIERAAILANGPVIDIDDALEMRLTGTSVAEEPLGGTLEEVERGYIVKVLEDNHWMIEGPQGAAALLGLHPSTLRSRMQKLGIKRPKS